MGALSKPFPLWPRACEKGVGLPKLVDRMIVSAKLVDRILIQWRKNVLIHLNCNE